MKVSTQFILIHEINLMQDFSIKLVDSQAERYRSSSGYKFHFTEQIELSEVVGVHSHHCGNIINVVINSLLHVPCNFKVCARELKEVDSTGTVNSHHERYIVVSLAILSRALLVIQGLESLVKSLLLRGRGINSVELLNLPLLLVKIHNNGFVVGLAQAVKEGAVLRQ